MWSSMLRDATPENTRNAKQWMSETVTARGLTDILTPLQMALAMLENARGVPYVFLLTDGAVKDERQIAQYLQVSTACVDFTVAQPDNVLQDPMKNPL